MRGWLLDTNVVSELNKPRPDPRVRAFVAAQPASRLHLSVVALAEIRFGIEKLSAAERRHDLTSWLERSVRPFFAGRILTISEDVLVRWRQMMEAGRKHGHTFGQPDLFIAATAAVAGLVVVTRDTKTFLMARVPVLDPWAGIYAASGTDQITIGELAQADLLAELARISAAVAVNDD